jgi:hypothetical protein
VTSRGTTGDDTACADVPAAFFDLTQNVYAVPLVRPLTRVDVPATTISRPLGCTVTTASVASGWPDDANCHPTTADSSAAVAVTFIGVPGST